MFPSPFEGGRLVIGKGVSSHFQINHTLTLGPPMLSGYRFGATYVGCKQFSPQEVGAFSYVCKARAVYCFFIASIIKQKVVFNVPMHVEIC